MRDGRPLPEIAAQLKQIADTKRDYLADTRALSFEHQEEDTFAFNMRLAGTDLPLTDHAHRQLGTHVGIPQPYYDRMRSEAPELLEDNVSHWLDTNPTRRLVRALGGQTRAYLSDSYRVLDNYDLAEAVLPTLAERGVEVRSTEITDTRFYIKGIAKNFEQPLKVGDAVRLGIYIANSEIGLGSLQIHPYVETLSCTNGMTVMQKNAETDLSLQKRHLGRKQAGEEGQVVSWISDETREADDRAFWLSARDLVTGMLTSAVLSTIVEKINGAADKKIVKPVMQAVEVTADRFSLTESEQGSVLEHLVRGNDLSAWGLSSAITRTADEVESYDRASELEAMGWKVIELPRQQWTSIAA